MKVVICHNYYGSDVPSGENAVVEAEKALLRDHSLSVLDFARHSDRIRNVGPLGLFLGACATPFNPIAYYQIRDLLRRECPEILHVHNTFPLLSPSVFYAARDLATATVLTLHNYRLFCSNAIPLRNGATCTLCLDNKTVVPALRYGCYRNSRIATLPLATGIALHRALRTWDKVVNAYIALTDFQKELLIKAGLPEKKIHVKPNFYPEIPVPVSWTDRENKAIFLGRLSEEKGVEPLVRAWAAMGVEAPRLEIIGDGPMKAFLERLINNLQCGSQIRLIGSLSHKDAMSRLRTSRLLVLPSVWFEGFPMVIGEAFALGVPVAASKIGPFPSLVKETGAGVLFEPGDIVSMATIIQTFLKNVSALHASAGNARSEFLDKYTAARNYDILRDIYATAIEEKRRR